MEKLRSTQSAEPSGALRAGVDRRTVLAGLTGLVAAAVRGRAGALAPMPRPVAGVVRQPVAAILDASGLAGVSGFALSDARTGALIEAHRADAALPPASVAKIPTALYALEALGPDFRFETRILATGPVVRGCVKGDLVLEGGGDPLLDTDALGELVAALAALGVSEVSGRFLVAASALPARRSIDRDQPDDAGYNPAISGSNLNFNRVQLRWLQGSKGAELSMHAPGQKFSAEIASIRAEAGGGPAPRHRFDARGEVWTLPSAALHGRGERWLPVRAPAAYAGAVMHGLALQAGLSLPVPQVVARAPEGDVLAVRRGAALGDVLSGMLRYSTNLTAEVVGLRASQASGIQPRTLQESGRAMSDWARDCYGLGPVRLVNHSGLTDRSGISAAEMVRLLAGASAQSGLSELLRERPVADGQGRTVRMGGVRVLAKTGTLYFASALAGYIEGGNGQRLAFAIMAADMPARRAMPSGSGRPAGARAWSGRARRQEHALLRRWMALLSG